MDWKSTINGYKSFLVIEKSLASNSVDAYVSDVLRVVEYIEYHNLTISPIELKLSHFENFLSWTTDLGMSSKSQARIISGVKGFYKYLVMEDLIKDNPIGLIESPKAGRKLPETLSYEDILKLINAIDLSKAEGTRNKAMLETLYSCGLRVSELIGLRISGLYFDEGFIRIVGKGDKERLVPIGKSAIKYINIYLDGIRNHIDIQSGHEDILFLNRRGKQLTRVMIFTIIKQLAIVAGIKKNISPHTFRHSFASHMVNAGADLRAVQDMLGHESITTTEIYTHLNRDYLRDEIMSHHPRNKKI